MGPKDKRIELEGGQRGRRNCRLQICSGVDKKNSKLKKELYFPVVILRKIMEERLGSVWWKQGYCLPVGVE